MRVRLSPPQPGFTNGVGHFTQVVWKGTTHAGTAISDCGKVIATNYYPPGNYEQAATVSYAMIGCLYVLVGVSRNARFMTDV